PLVADVDGHIEALQERLDWPQPRRKRFHADERFNGGTNRLTGSNCLFDGCGDRWNVGGFDAHDRPPATARWKASRSLSASWKPTRRSTTSPLRKISRVGRDET